MKIFKLTEDTIDEAARDGDVSWDDLVMLVRAYTHSGMSIYVRIDNGELLWTKVPDFLAEFAPEYMEQIVYDPNGDAWQS